MSKLSSTVVSSVVDLYNKTLFGHKRRPWQIRRKGEEASATFSGKGSRCLEVGTEYNLSENIRNFEVCTHSRCLKSKYLFGFPPSRVSAPCKDGRWLIFIYQLLSNCLRKLKVFVQ